MKFPRRYLSREQRLALHESGHAAVAVVCRMPVRQVSILNDSETAGRAYIKMAFTPVTDGAPARRPAPTTPHARCIGRRQALAFFAGRLAEHRAMTGEREPPDYDFMTWFNSPARSDLLHAAGLAKYFAPPGGDAETYERRLHNDAYRLVSSRRVWPAVVALAGELQRRRTINGGDATQIIVNALANSKRRWPDRGARRRYIEQRINQLSS